MEKVRAALAEVIKESRGKFDKNVKAVTSADFKGCITLNGKEHRGFLYWRIKGGDLGILQATCGVACFIADISIITELNFDGCREALTQVIDEYHKEVTAAKRLINMCSRVVKGQLPQPTGIQYKGE